MEHFSDLNTDEKTLLLRYPAYVSLLASTVEGGLDEKEIKTVSKLNHIKTFTCDSLLADFYRSVEKNFMHSLQEIIHELPVDKTKRTRAIERELNKLEQILNKLGPEYAAALHQSMKVYKEQVSKAHHSVLEYFIFPMPIKGLSD